jgi:hypothetical protein
MSQAWNCPVWLDGTVLVTDPDRRNGFVSHVTVLSLQLPKLRRTWISTFDRPVAEKRYRRS